MIKNSDGSTIRYVKFGCIVAIKLDWIKLLELVWFEFGMILEEREKILF